ncbi:antitoxin family protein [Fimbriiglobus ruber]|uniref:DUF104 domain-containing protein n=1 Tax=Fimbriiglobus ruber TaxID=1908690 RepID=A0A225E2A7_9BACT|nr:antitoxin family protein [Fimbriiglobus ruber]OWK43619.1 hypothetical protein FRUB_03218 [Fimbriiglobus ruber]
MITHVEAVYENGILRPLRPLDLEDKQKVTITIAGQSESSDDAHVRLAADRWDEFCAALDTPPKMVSPLRKLLTESSVFDGPDSTTSSICTIRELVT